MDVEFLDLIKTFEKTLKRIEVLDHKVTSFKEVLETLKWSCLKKLWSCHKTGRKKLKP